MIQFLLLNIFLDSPKAHVAVRFVTGGYSEFDLSGIADLEKYSIYLRCDATYSPIVIEVAALGVFDDFADFKEEVLSNDAEVKDGRLDYSTIYGETLTMFTEPDRIPLINGNEIDYHPDIVYRSPFIKSNYGSGIINITVGEQTGELDFN